MILLIGQSKARINSYGQALRDPRLQGDKAKLLYILCKLVVRARHLPESYELQGVRINQDIVYQGEYTHVRKGKWKGNVVTLKIRKPSPHEAVTDKFDKVNYCPLPEHLFDRPL